ncbi:helix-turn-helix transcriptional regulator [Massilia horti]|uniref:Uncharacterized protein n=1 Tax=Massilia horti TaxID=2562153 RepID=A0A4Y9SYL1_9BURK|nr:helix-turn-helix transcriptional regulator [Massilia horti]TFW30304.1 hypothetical protein E4O92_17205 [Massilia horti]
MPYVLNTVSNQRIKVPDAEFEVLTVLASLKKEVHGPAISRASNGSISVAAIYQLLSRLEKRGLVQKREEYVEVGDITAKRVLYKVYETVNLAQKGKPDEAFEVETTSARPAGDPAVREVDVGKASSLALPARTAFA